MSTAERLRALADRVAEERARPAAQRASSTDDGPLTGVERTLRRAGELIDVDRAEATDQLNQAARVISDSWSYSSLLGQDILRVVQALR